MTLDYCAPYKYSYLLTYLQCWFPGLDISNAIITRGKVLSWEYRSPRKRNSRTCVRNSLLSELSWECITYLLCVKWFVGLFTLENVCLHWKKIPRFTAFLDSNLHTRLAIVTEKGTWACFSPRNLPKKFRPHPSTFYLVIVVRNKQTNKQTDRQTDRQTNQSR